MQLRTIKPTDYKAVARLIREAFTPTEFGYGNEAELVEKIRQSKEYLPDLELVAILDDTIVGYGLLSEVQIVNEQETTTGLVLAPLATSPHYQKQGIGKQLMLTLEDRAKQLGYPFISILGHPEYYAKFGYTPAKDFNVTAPFDVPVEAFMLKPLFSDALDRVHGTVQYSAAFA